MFAAAIATSLAMAAPAMAHPITPPGQDGTVAFAGGTTPAHSLGLACAEDVSPAVGFLPLECTIGFGR